MPKLFKKLYLFLLTLVIEEPAFKAVLPLDIVKIAPVGLYGDNPMF